MQSVNYYERHLGDYAKDTRHLTMLEHGAYTLLLDRYYSTEQPIPAGQAYRYALARTRDEKAAVDAVLNEFFFLQDGVWKKRRCEQEIAKAHLRIKTAQENGKHGGRPPIKPKGEPAKTQRVFTGFSLGLKNETQQKAYQTPDSSKKEEGVSDDARAREREPLISPEANGLADEIARIVGHDPEHPPPQWYGAAMHTSKWLREGWMPEIILIAVRRAMGRRSDDPPLSIKFFENEIAREHARQAAPLPEAIIAESAQVTTNATHTKPHGIMAALERNAERLKRGIDPLGTSSTGLLPNRRRERS